MNRSFLRSSTFQFRLFAVSYCALWVVSSTVFLTNYHEDILEQYFVADQCGPASGKHSALITWYLAALRTIFFEAGFVPYLATGTLVFVMLLAVRRLSCDYFAESADSNDGPALALPVVLAATSCRFLIPGKLLYSHDLAQSFCWTLAILCFYRALVRNRPGSWALTGLWLGIGLHAKYSLILFAPAMPLFMIFNRHARRYWKTPGPYATMAIALLIFLPHLVWLFRNDFITLQYVLHGSKYVPDKWYFEQPIPTFVIFPVKFGLGLLLALLPPILVLTPLTGWAWQWRWRPDLAENGPARFRIAFLGTMIGLPLLLFLGIAATGRALPNRYLMPIGVYAPLLFLYVLQLKTDTISRRRAGAIGLAFAFGFMILWSGSLFLNARFGNKPSRACFPGKKLAEIVENIWTERYGSTPCPFVSDMYEYGLSGAVHVYGKMRIPVHDKEATYFSSDEEMNRRGGIVLWHDKTSPGIGPNNVRKRFPAAERLPDLVIPYGKPYSSKFPPERIHIAIIPPDRGNSPGNSPGSTPGDTHDTPSTIP